MAESWAREWLRDVGSARRALETEARRLERLKVARLSIGDPLAAVGGGRGHVTDVNARSDAYMQSQDDMAHALAWARDALAEFDAVMLDARTWARGPVLDGTYVAELVYRLGCGWREAAQVLEMSVSTAHARLAVLADVLDREGPRVLERVRKAS